MELSTKTRIFFRIMVYFAYAGYIVSFFKIKDVNTDYIDALNNWTRLFVGVMLLLIFNPIFTVITNEKFKRELALYAGIFMVTSSVLYETYAEEIKNGIKHKLLLLSGKE